MREISQAEIDHILERYGVKKNQEVADKARELTEEGISKFEANDGPADFTAQAKLAGIIVEGTQGRGSINDLLWVCDLCQKLIGQNRLERKRSGDMARTVMQMYREWGMSKSPTNPSLRY